MVNDIKHHSDLSNERDESDDDLDFAFEGDSFRDFLKLNTVREKVNWENEKERQQFFRRLYRSVKDKKDLDFLDIWNIFRPEEIDWLLIEDVNNDENAGLLIKLVARSGYKDRPELNEDGEPILRRTTAVHHAARLNYFYLIHDLFEIYDRFDVNYIDEFGLTHFHAACKFNYLDKVAQFLVLGQDPNVTWTETGDSPLHLALKNSVYKKLFELMLKSGADPNLTNKDGLTPLHALCEDSHGVDSMKMLFKISDEKHRTVQIDAIDKNGRTPLHLAADKVWNTEKVKCLLRRGANSNVADTDGLTPLHVICKKCSLNIDMFNIFFEINDEVNQLVQINVMDKLGRTPLQWAVANLMPDMVEFLLNRGADLSSFVFPTEDYFAVRFNNPDCEIVLHIYLKLASNALVIVEHLEKRGYKLNRTDALTIMHTFSKYKIFDCDYFDSHGLARISFNKEEFVRDAKTLMVIPTLSLYDLVQLKPEEAQKLLTYADYSKLADSTEWSRFPDRRICLTRLMELMTRGFCRRWALQSFMEMTRNKFPISWCENFIDPLANKDLYYVCLQAIEIRDELD
ncbi:uncharacterized protein LOC111693477 [Trichogramma pretiosum]|uniref:uncharacterized protein LOC111693477 n=1 Tax=Trichogramma pretiosum TaxID=7493 RepID=UPI000C71926A|nr:uncharacterized protein LOC111693477 [Trichogramma pretiosum]